MKKIKIQKVLSYYREDGLWKEHLVGLEDIEG